MRGASYSPNLVYPEMSKKSNVVSSMVTWNGFVSASPVETYETTELGRKLAARSMGMVVLMLLR